MANTITITYDESAVKYDTSKRCAPICDIFVPGSCAADMEVFDETYYDTNVKGQGFGSELDDFLAMQVSHPGLIAAIKKAIKDGSYAMTTEDAQMETMVDELNVALASRGLTFAWA